VSFPNTQTFWPNQYIPNQPSLVLVTINESDSLSMSDSTSLVYEYIYFESDVIASSDSLVDIYGTILGRSDSLSLSDSAKVWYGYILNNSDTYTISDSIFDIYGFVESASDLVSQSDAETLLYNTVFSPSDDLVFSDDLFRIDYTCSTSDKIVLTDSLTVLFGNSINIIFADSMELSDDVETMFVVYLLLSVYTYECNDRFQMDDGLSTGITLNPVEMSVLKDSVYIK